jgi:hypothetical protein
MSSIDEQGVIIRTFIDVMSNRKGRGSLDILEEIQCHCKPWGKDSGMARHRFFATDSSRPLMRHTRT